MGDAWGGDIKFPMPGTEPKLSKPAQDPNQITDTWTQTTETGRVIPLVYGTAKMAGNVIEKAGTQPLSGYQAIRQANTEYSTAGAICANAGSLYVVVTTGTTGAGSGPTGSGNNIADGSVRWAYLAPAITQWAQSTSYSVVGTIVFTVHDLTAIVTNSSEGQAVTGYYVLKTAGVSATSGSGPQSQGADITDGTCHWTYIPPGHRQVMAIALCEGPIYWIGAAWVDKETLTAFIDIPHVSLDLVQGLDAQARPTWATALAFTETYNHTAVLFLDYKSGQSNASPNIQLEVAGVLATAIGADVNPADIVYDLLTDGRRGAGWNPARIDNTTTATSLRTYCSAAGINVSWVIDSQRSAQDLLKDILTLTNSDAVWSGGKLKFVPRCDQTIGAYVPNVTPVYDLGPDDFLEQPDIVRRRSADCFNSVPVQFTRRHDSQNQKVYTTDIVDNPDLADVDTRGRVNKSPTVTLPFVLSPDTATMLSRVYAQRSLAQRNTYTVRLPGWKYCLLEPTDIVTLTDPILGLSKAPVKITSYEDSVEQDGTSVITLTCEDYPAAANHAAKYTPQAGDGYRPTSPNPVNGIVVQPTSGSGVNLLYGSDFSAGVPPTASPRAGGGWGTLGAGGWSWSTGVNLNTSWSLHGETDAKNLNHNNTFYVGQAGRVGDGSALDLMPARNSNTDLTPIAVDPSKRYAWSVYTGAHRCYVSLYVEWYKADGSLSTVRAFEYWPTADAINNAEKSGGTTLAGYKRLFMVVQPPSDAASCLPVVRKSDTLAGETDSYMFLCRGQFEEVGPTALVPGPWVPGPQSIAALAAQDWRLSGTLRYGTSGMTYGYYVTGAGFVSAAAGSSNTVRLTLIPPRLGAPSISTTQYYDGSSVPAMTLGTVQCVQVGQDPSGTWVDLQVITSSSGTVVPQPPSVCWAFNIHIDFY